MLKFSITTTDSRESAKDIALRAVRRHHHIIFYGFRCPDMPLWIVGCEDDIRHIYGDKYDEAMQSAPIKLRGKPREKETTDQSATGGRDAEDNPSS